jgi:Multiubiquitin
MSEAVSEKVSDKIKLTEITVNKKPVLIDGPRVTGLQIKEAAIAAGLPIELDFQLKQLKPNGDRPIIGDDDVVTVNKNSKFVATASDDNS